MGWRGWRAAWAERVGARALLARCVGRMRQRKLALAMAAWVRTITAPNPLTDPNPTTNANRITDPNPSPSPNEPQP